MLLPHSQDEADPPLERLSCFPVHDPRSGPDGCLFTMAHREPGSGSKLDHAVLGL